MDKKLYKKTIIKNLEGANKIIKKVYYDRQGLESKKETKYYRNNKLLNERSWYKSFYKNGLLIKYSVLDVFGNIKNDFKVIDEFKYDDEGSLVEYRYIKDSYDNNIDKCVIAGDKITIDKQSFSKGKTITFYCNDELVKAVTYKKGKLIKITDYAFQEDTQYFYENGKIKIEVISTVFDEDCNCIKAYEYKYNENDELEAIINLESGKRIIEFYYTNGELVNEKHYCNGKVTEDINYEYEYWEDEIDSNAECENK